MPASAEEGRDIMINWIRRLQPNSLLDIGAGCGTYAKPWQNVAPRPYLIGVEAWRPYINRFDLWSLYDFVINEDVRSMMLWNWPRVDVVVLGDVLEHMTKDDAVRVWNLARASARKAVFLSIPIIDCPQGHVHGNPFEEHIVPDWNASTVLSTFDGITSYWTGTVVGRYMAPAFQEGT